MSQFLWHQANVRRVFALSTLVWLSLSTIPVYRCLGQDQPLGSTATLEQIQKGWRSEPAAQNVPTLPREADLVTEPAAAPALRLEHRFWPNESSLRPGAGLIYLNRALVFYHSGSPSILMKWREYQVELGDARPDPADLTERLEPFQLVFTELERFAESENQESDLRLRDLRGPEVYGFLLPEFVEYRELARLLRFRALEQLGRHDFAGAITSIRCGYRLAAFVRQGETLIQQLVGIAIEGLMQDAVEEAIRTPGCPNLYYALATVPHERRTLLRSLEFELSSFERALPLLKDPEQRSWDAETWKQEWTRALENFGEYEGLSGGSSRGLGNGSLLLATELASDARAARRRLLKFGLAPDKVAAMCAEQVLAVDTAREMRTTGEALLAAALEPYPAAQQATEVIMTGLNDELAQPRSLGSYLKALLLPAVSQTVAADMRVVSMHHRLLTIEAVRHHAATHDGKLPKDLTELKELLPQVDLHTGKLLGYELKSGPEGEWAEFPVEAKTLPEELRIRRLQFRN